MLKIFIGYDHRQPVSYNVLQQSILTRSSIPVAITPLVLDQLPIKRSGLTPFTYSRFLVPYLCGYKGTALFLDADMLVLEDINELFKLMDLNKAVMVSRGAKKFEWASVMLFNNAECTLLTPEYIEKNSGLHTLSWLESDQIGDLPREWNHLVGYDPVPEKTPKLLHYTQGVPIFPETRECDYAELWGKEFVFMKSALSWTQLMGDSVHAVCLTDGRRVPRLVFGEEKLACMVPL